MGRFILMRLLGLIPVLLILSMITFFLMHEVPGGPWKEGQRPFSDEQLAALKARYGLDKPVWQQYLIWIAGVLRLDFGMSFDHPDESVIALIRRTWPTTMHLGGMTILTAFGIGIPLGIIAALRQNSWIDYLATLLSIALVNNFSHEFLFDLSFYFILLYMFYLLDRVAIWGIEQRLMKGKRRKRKLIDSVSVIFIVASMAGYFLIVMWYNFILPGKIT